MPVSFINRNVELTDFLIDFIKSNISDYRLSEITNGNAPEVPNVTDVHPLALEVANMDQSRGNEYDSILPAITVESTIANTDELRVLGSQKPDICVVDQKFLNQINLANYSGSDKQLERYKRGLLLTDSMVQEIQDLYDAAESDGKKLYFYLYKKNIQEMLNISLWADNKTVRDILLIIVDSLIERARMSKKECLSPARNFSPRGIKLDWNTGYYNLETYGRIFFGAEGNLTFMNAISTVVIDETVSDTEIKGILEKIETLKQTGNKFVAKGEVIGG